MSLDWMAWTGPTAVFFLVIAAILLGMTAWQLTSPSIERRGILPISTTRGDRIFIGLLSAAYTHLLWIGLTDWNLWWALVISVILAGAIMRFG